MQFYRKLYLGDNIRYPGLVRRRLKRHAGNLDVYVVTLCGMDDPHMLADCGGQIEFYHNAMLHQPYYRRHEPYIVGLARNRTDAIALCARIVQEAVLATGHAQIYPYLFPSGQIAEYFET